MKLCQIIIITCWLLFPPSQSFAAETVNQQIVAGAGPSTVVAQLFFEFLKKKPVTAKYEFQVPAKSSKHAGGIKNSDDYLFGRIGRPLNRQEQQLNKEELFLARVPFVFVVGPKVGIRKLTLTQVRNIFLGRISNWKMVGGPDRKITVLGRESTEAFFAALKAAYPSFSKASFDQTVNKDHQVAEYLDSPAGDYAISFGAKPNFSFINTLEVIDFSAGVNVGLVYDLKNSDHPVVTAAREYAHSSEWRGGLALLDLEPADR